MRVFIGLTLNDTLKSHLESLQAPFRANAQRGNFTHRINFHLTLAFIGEVSEEVISELEVLLDELNFDSFELTLADLGCFKRKTGDIWWVGIQKSASLRSLRNQIVSSLKEKGIPYDEALYVPHLTLVRNYRSNSDQPMTLPGLDPVPIPIKSVSLMKSHRVLGELRYSEIYCVKK